MRKHWPKVVVVAWWFALAGTQSQSNPGAGRVVGPFVTKEQCDDIRASFTGVTVTLCWQDTVRVGPR